jgi:hypothetical protein
VKVEGRCRLSEGNAGMANVDPRHNGACLRSLLGDDHGGICIDGGADKAIAIR